MDSTKIYPRSQDSSMVYLKSVVDDPQIEVGEYTIYHDWERDPREFRQHNVMYLYPVNGEKLTIGKFSSLACGCRFLFNAGNHTLRSLSNYTFPLQYEEWGPMEGGVKAAWDNKGSITVGNDVWIGYEALIMAGVTIGDGAIIGSRAVVTKDVPPYTIVAGVPAKPIRRRFDEETIETLLALRWWDWEDERIQKALPAIQSGDLEKLKEFAE